MQIPESDLRHCCELVVKYLNPDVVTQDHKLSIGPSLVTMSSQIEKDSSQTLHTR